jgi:hypothetical protein
MSARIILTNEKGLFQNLTHGPKIARRLLYEAIDDMGDKIEELARLNAPIGEGKFTYKGRRLTQGGALKRHPIDRLDTRIGVGQSIKGEAPGFASVRGGDPANRGRFSKGKAAYPGELVASSVITLPKEPHYAKFVHFGTTTPIVSPTGKLMKFFYKGKKYRAYAVKGQEPQPYLEEAFNKVNLYYVDIKVRELKAEIEALI